MFYRRLMSVADDYGLYDARTPILRSALYPLQLDKMSECNIQRCLSACEAAGLILLYSHNEKPYLMILGFDQQGKSMPKWPLPNGYEVLKVSDKKYELRKFVTGRNDSPQPVTYANAYSETESNTNTYTKSETETKEAAPDGLLDFPPPSRPSSMVPLPGSVEEVEAHMRQCLVHPLDPDALRSSAERFYDHYVEQGNFIRNWKSKATIWTKDDALREQRQKLANQPPGGESDPFDPRFRKNI